jgi:hypothetical protein
MSFDGWLMEKGSQRRRKRAVLYMLPAFFISRIIFYLTGVRYVDTMVSGDHLSFISYELLQTDMLSSIWNFHVQPPLLNLLCGIVINIFGDSHTVVFHAIYILAGMALMTALYKLLVSLGVPYRFAAGLALLFIVSPDSILYENMILYTYLVATLLVLSGVSLYNYIRTEKWYWGGAAFTLWSAVILTRSMFHLIWFVAGITIIIAVSPKIWKQTVIIAAIPFLLAFGWYANNYIHFGDFSSSTWMGMNLSRITLSGISGDEKIDLARNGLVSELIFLKPFPSFWQFSDVVILPEAPPTGVTVLDKQYINKGYSNYNNIIYPTLCKQYLKDSIAVIKNHPYDFIFGSLRKSFSMYFAPSNEWFGIWAGENGYFENFTAIYPFTFIWNAVFYGDFSKDVNNSGWFILAAYIITAVYWIRRLIRSFPTLRSNAPVYTVVLFMLMTVAYVTLVGNLFELGENMRFHYQIDPFVMVLFAVPAAIQIRKYFPNKTA